MSLRTVVAAPFRGRGQDRLDENEFIVALSLDRGWYSPDQAARVVDLAIGRGLLAHDDEAVRATFDPDTVDIPAGFTPDEALLQTDSPFEQVLDAMVAAGHPKRDTVAGINQLQAGAGLTIGAAAVLYARRNGIEVPGAVDAARRELVDP